MLLSDILERIRGKSTALVFVDEKGAETARSADALHRDTLALASRLREAGAEAGMRIGIMAPNSYWWMVWDLACIALKCVSVALTEEQSKEKLRDVIDRYRLRLLGVHPAWLTDRREEAGDVVALDGLLLIDGKPLAKMEAADPAGAHSLAFSSGTTGKIKGLIIGTAGTEKLLDLYFDAFGVEPGERFLTFLPFANFQQRAAYYFCLYHGVDFVSVASPQLFAAIKKHKPTYTIAPPIFYETLHNMAQAGVPKATVSRERTSARLRELTGGRIRYMITGMAPIRRNTLDFFWENGIALYEAFGVTEAGMVTWNKPNAVKVGTVGKPAEPGSVHLSPDGEVIVTRDALWSLGYFQGSEEDQKATFLSPRSVTTGDIAEFDSDGFLSIVGRKKDAIITRSGEKFHPEPIESSIQDDPRVKAAVVLGGDKLAGITAIISVDRSADAAVQDDLRTHVNRVNRCLPASQQVKRVIFTTTEFGVDNGLRTKNLKLNRTAIYAAFAEQFEHRTEAVAG
jgi:long-chain acyl-CoA synthetase